MTNPKLRDALAERLDKFFEEATDRQEHPTTMQHIASRLLESVPGEEELAKQLYAAKRPSALCPFASMKPVSRNGYLMQARFLRQHIGWWVE